MNDLREEDINDTCLTDENFPGDLEALRNNNNFDETDDAGTSKSTLGVLSGVLLGICLAGIGLVVYRKYQRGNMMNVNYGWGFGIFFL